MTPERVIELLRMGACHPERRAEQPCATCDEIDAACALVAEMAAREPASARLAGDLRALMRRGVL